MMYLIDKKSFIVSELIISKHWVYFCNLFGYGYHLVVPFSFFFLCEQDLDIGFLVIK